MRLDHLLSKELNYCLVGHAARECRVGGLLMGGMSAPFFVVCFVSRCCVYVIIFCVLFGCVLGFSGCTLGVAGAGAGFVLGVGVGVVCCLRTI